MRRGEDGDMIEQNQNKVYNIFHNIMNSMMLVLFLPVLFCVMFIGNKMDYYDDVKADILVPNVVLTLIAVAAFGVCLWLLYQGRKIQLTKRLSRYLDLGLIILFTGFFFFCTWLSRETVFEMSVDQGIVREAAKDVAFGRPFGYRIEFSIDYNNLPITYIMGRIYRMGMEWTWFQHTSDYLWIIVGCLMVTVAGFCCCEIIKKLTRNPIAVLIAFALYVATAGLSPWKHIPYTDSWGIPFPILCFWLYLCSRDCRYKVGKILFLIFSFVAGGIGGFIKPSAYIAVFAVLGLEAVKFLTEIIHWAQKRRGETPEEEKSSLRRQVMSSGISLILSLIMFCVLYAGAGLCKNFIIEDIGLEYNEELESTLQYYFFSSTNELTTGSFTIEDYHVFAEFQHSKADRNAACMERAWERIRQRGVIGTLYFSLKKLVKTFNDGTFAWTDVRYYQIFPEDQTHDNVIAGYLRSLFIPGGANQAKYDTLAELVWIFILLGVPGIVLEKDKKSYYTVFSVLMIGILVYIMLFESGARYIYIFLPIFIVMSVCGMDIIGAAVRGKNILNHKR